MAKYNPKDLKAKTTDELKEKLKLLRKEQFNLRFQVIMDKAKILQGLNLFVKK